MKGKGRRNPRAPTRMTQCPGLSVALATVAQKCARTRVRAAVQSQLWRIPTPPPSAAFTLVWSQVGSLRHESAFRKDQMSQV